MMRNALRSRFHATVATLAVIGILVPPAPAFAQPAPAPAGRAASQAWDAQTWPRVIADGDREITVYQPQVERWRNNVLEARAAVSVDRPGAEAKTLGVVWFKARTQVDKANDQVALDDVEVVKTNFPSDMANAAAYAAALSRDAQGLRSISLARLQTSLAVAEAEGGTQALPVKNEPPKIIFSKTPALLVLVDGKPQLRPLTGKLLRVINTPALIVFDEAQGVYYLRALKHWWSAQSVEGAWSLAAQPPAQLAGLIKAEASRVNLLDNAPPEIADAVAAGALPVLHVSETPAALVQSTGDPEYAPIADTQLLYVKNTSSQVIVDVSSQDYYVLIAGRWFRSKSLDNGPWSFVASNQLPADFSKIPESHPKGEVLASVSGTPQAQEALIDSQIPQTATVDRRKATLTVRYDGKPELRPVPGTSLEYVVNAAVPVIKVNNVFYAIENGVWFTAASLNGPWRAAAEVPSAIYAIPPESSLHYVTYAQVYGATDDVVYTGYTPGYYGAVVAPAGVVVYGTGYDYPSWIGAYWYPAPLTYGYGAGFAWGAATGFTFGAIAGAAWAGGGWGWHGGWGWGRNVVVNNFNHVSFNQANIYNRWNRNIVHTRIGGGGNHIANVAGNRLENRGGGHLAGPVGARNGAAHFRQNHPRANDLYAGRNGEVMRRGAQGWQQHQGGHWANAAGGNLRQLNREQAARFRGERVEHFRAGGFAGGGFRGGFPGGGGFRGGGFHGGGFHGGGFHGGGFHRR